MAAPPDEPSRPNESSNRPPDDGSRRAPRVPDRKAVVNQLGPPRAAPRTPDMHTDPDPVASSLAPPFVPGYTVAKEIDRGGMGIVYEASDLVFNRVVAIKTLLPGRPFDADATRRFDTEAHITARLQHPNVPPVFAVGKLADGRPYVVMKLVRGRHMGKLLKERPTPAHGLTRVLAAFEQVCQAVGYAHARGVLHRDLKPSNVMVGEFGEVQVMDWGQAKEGVAPGTAPLTDSTQTDPWGTGVPSVVPLPGAPAGQAPGTPAYMAPEQARGDWDQVGPWSDVFALGGVLADILTGQPPFVAETPFETLALAGSGTVAPAFARLDASGADPALLALTKRCLAPDPQHRPASGKDLADAVAAYRAGVEARVRKAEAERAAAVAKERETELRAAEAETKRADEASQQARAERATATAQRKSRQAQLLLAVAGVFLLLGVGTFAWWLGARGAEPAAEKKPQDARAEADPAAEERNRTAARAALKSATGLRAQQKYREAAEALVQAEKLAAGLDDVLPGVKREKADTEFARELDEIRARRSMWIPNPTGDGGRLNTDGLADAYTAAFAKRGIVIPGDPVAAAKRVAESPIRAELLRALDDWALAETSLDAADRVWDVAHKADPATRTRTAEWRRDPKRVVQLEETAESATTALMVAGFIARQNAGDAHPLLSLTQARHPLDFDVVLALAVWHHAHATRRVPPERIGDHLRAARDFYRAARALRPDHPGVLSNLGLLLHVTGDQPTALMILREAVKQHPKEYVTRYNLGAVLLAINQPGQAEPEFREATQLNPNYAAAHTQLGFALLGLKRGNEALAAFQQALKLDANQPVLLTNLGFLMLEAQKFDDAVAYFRRAIERIPAPARALASRAHFGLGLALERKNDVAGAEAAYREAVRLDAKQHPELAKKYPPDK